MQNELLRILARERHTVMLITHDVEEAIHLADRILVLSPRPARIQATFDVPFAHPRRVSNPAAQALRVAILKELGVEEASSDADLDPMHHSEIFAVVAARAKRSST